MEISIGDYVSRKSYNNDTIFKVINIQNGIYYLKGAEVRLFADSEYGDLVKCDIPKETIDIDNRNISSKNKNYFYLPGKILHIDGDNEYLEKCLKYYKSAGLYAVGKKISEDEMPNQITSLLTEYKPDIVILTGHDAYYHKKGNKSDLNNYKNSRNFIKAIKAARKYEKSQEKLVIIAGACQSNYEELIKAGANFASSPKRVNIHALDPAIIAHHISMTERNKCIDLVGILKDTRYGPDGIGGIITNGLMYVGFPRWI